VFNSIYNFVLRMNNKQVTEGNFFMVVVELLATVVIVAIIRNT